MAYVAYNDYGDRAHALDRNFSRGMAGLGAVSRSGLPPQVREFFLSAPVKWCTFIPGISGAAIAMRAWANTDSNSVTDTVKLAAADVEGTAVLWAAATGAASLVFGATPPAGLPLAALSIACGSLAATCHDLKQGRIPGAEICNALGIATDTLDPIVWAIGALGLNDDDIVDAIDKATAPSQAEIAATKPVPLTVDPAKAKAAEAKRKAVTLAREKARVRSAAVQVDVRKQALLTAEKIATAEGNTAELQKVQRLLGDGYPAWVWGGAAAAAVLGIFLFMRRRAR